MHVLLVVEIRHYEETNSKNLGLHANYRMPRRYAGVGVATGHSLRRLGGLEVDLHHPHHCCGFWRFRRAPLVSNFRNI